MIGLIERFFGNRRLELSPLKLKNALLVRQELKTADQVRMALFDQPTGRRCNFKTGKVPDLPYRTDLVSTGPIGRVF